MSKEEWIITYIKNSVIPSVSHLDEKFVDDYIKEFNEKHIVQPYGANTCKNLNYMLNKMYKKGLLGRFRTGIHGLTGMGFPKWVYNYYLIN